ncbi:hypothetical protein HanIR_Chr09g0408611 [Helianthus annuus]|nr:hypothetical protein HanIR_Chr09g0408611 [Helianthus annuus]
MVMSYVARGLHLCGRTRVGDGNTMGTRRGCFLNVSNVGDVSDKSIQPVSIYF